MSKQVILGLLLGSFTVVLLLLASVVFLPLLFGSPEAQRATPLNVSDVAPGSHQISPAPAFSGKTLAALPTSGWLTNGGNLFKQVRKGRLYRSSASKKDNKLKMSQKGRK